MGILRRGAQLDTWMVFFDRELPFQKLHEQRRNALRGVDLLFVEHHRWLHFHGKMQEFKNEVAQYVVFVDVIGIDLLELWPVCSHL